MESLVKCMGDISCIYYHTSLILIKLLPINICNEELLTKFESESFEVLGEINYQKLKILYHTYVLTQSETLHLLAVAYDNHTWRQSYKKVPELKLSYIIHFLIVNLSIYKKKFSEYIDAYYNFKLEPVLYQYKGSNSSKWQDLYMHLYLASNKLQLAYSHILSVLQDIDNDVIENITNEDCMKNTAQKLNAAEKSIETAKDFLEFSCLFLVKFHISDSTINRLQTNIPTSIENSDTRIVADSEPEIIDEVFEEYITEEYLKPLSEGTDEISLYNYNRDKMLFKNFMTELKDALADKKKSMSERESKALQRMYKSIIKTASNEQLHRIPTPPPMPLFNIFSVIQRDNKGSNNATELQLNELPEKSNINKTINESKQNSTERNINDNLMGKIPPTINISLPKNTEFSSFSLPPFLKVEEETFIGNGENSEDDEETKVKSEQKEII
ncbi:hypothetical protein WN48_11177 [Eufriesea mexicana]|uniref:Uncharacterized protein n=2 Tax=Eufriesea mexicana TaxID=516756 RepID=A0A310S931_9HYME|nr:hypothetical protein WN48_11177 [Eufriesea mexicana]